MQYTVTCENTTRWAGKVQIYSGICTRQKLRVKYKKKYKKNKKKLQKLLLRMVLFCNVVSHCDLLRTIECNEFIFHESSNHLSS